MGHVPLEVVDSGLDWVTLTARIPGSGMLLASKAENFMRSEQERGCFLRPWGMSGYEGFICGQVAAGVRRDSGIVRLSSKLARENWRDFYEHAEGCSRLDAQATFRFREPATSVIASTFNRAVRFRRRKARGASVSIWREAGGSATVYIGKRASDFFCRVYDKHAESGQEHYLNCVRYEVEVKGAAAWSNLVDLQRETEQLKPSARSLLECEIIRAWVLHYLRAHGIALETAGVPNALIMSASPNSDLHRSLVWLKEQVGPTVERICEQGFAQEAYNSLFARVPCHMRPQHIGSSSPLSHSHEQGAILETVIDGGEYGN